MLTFPVVPTTQVWRRRQCRSSVEFDGGADRRRGAEQSRAEVGQKCNIVSKHLSQLTLTSIVSEWNGDNLLRTMSPEAAVTLTCTTLVDL